MTDYHEPSVGDEIHVTADELRQRLGDGDWSTISTAELRALRARVAELEDRMARMRIGEAEACDAADRRGYDRAIAALTRVLDGEPRGVTDTAEGAKALDRVKMLVRCADEWAPLGTFGRAYDLLRRETADDETTDAVVERLIRERDSAFGALSAARAERTEIARLRAAIAAAVPAIRAGLDEGGGYSPEAVRARIAAVDAVHALADALEGEAPAAVLSAAELEVVRGVLRAARVTWPALDAAAYGDLCVAIEEWMRAGRPLAGEESEG